MALHLALASLTQRPVRTLLTALGIAVAVGSMVIFLSVGEGLRRAFSQTLESVGPDLQVSFGDLDSTSSLTSLPELPIGYLERLREDGPRYGVERVIPLLLHLRSGLTPGASFAFEGLPPDVRPSDLYPDVEIVAGRGLRPEDAGRGVAVIGEAAAARSRLELGDTLRLNPRASFEIVGLASSGGGLTENLVFVPLGALQRALGIDDRLSFLALELEDPSRAKEVAAALSARYPELGFQTREDVFSFVEQGIRISDVVRLGISAIALIVGAIAVANTMLMSVLERTREFGVVRAVGARPRFLFSLVLLEAVALSAAGAVLGMVFGGIGIRLVNGVAQDLTGLDVAALTPRLALFAIGVGLTMGLLSGLAPAFRAARIPVAVAMARE